MLCPCQLHAPLSCAAASPEEALPVSCNWTTGTPAASPFSSLMGTESIAEFPAAAGRKESMLEKSQVLGERQGLNQTPLIAMQQSSDSPLGALQLATPELYPGASEPWPSGL